MVEHRVDDWPTGSPRDHEDRGTLVSTVGAAAFARRREGIRRGNDCTSAWFPQVSEFTLESRSRRITVAQDVMPLNVTEAVAFAEV